MNIKSRLLDLANDLGTEIAYVEKCFSPEENRDCEAEQVAARSTIPDIRDVQDMAKGLEPCNFDKAVENLIEQGKKESQEHLDTMSELLKSISISFV